MSLDVSLYLETEDSTTCPHCGVEIVGITDTECVFDANVTHNLNTMAGEAGIYQACWRPEELGITKAGGLIPLLRDGIAKMEAEPERFKAFNPENGWGSYDTFLPWLKEYLAACEKYPDAGISVSR